MSIYRIYFIKQKTDFSNDIRGLQFADGLDVLSNGSIMVAFIIQMVSILPEDVNHTVLVILLTLCQTDTRK